MQQDGSLPAATSRQQAYRQDGRLRLAAAAAIVLVLAYLLPFFPQRIAAAVTTFTGGSQVALSFPVLVFEQHYVQTTLPIDETLQDVALTLAPLDGLAGSGWGWLLRVLTTPGSTWQHASFWLMLALPLLAALATLVFVGLAWRTERGLVERLIPPTLNLAIMAPLGLAFAWLHQIDFSGYLLALERSALMPAIGFWLALLASVVLLVSVAPLRRKTLRPIITWWALVLAVAFLVWILARAKPQPYLEIWRFIADGITVTLRLVVTSFVLILFVSLLGGLGRISKSKLIYGASSLYVEIVRGIPLMVQLLFIWFALPQVFETLGNLFLRNVPALAGFGQQLVDLRLDPFVAAVVGLTICYGAYGSEIFRAGISSIHHGQMEAARSLGMSSWQAMRFIILPQAVRVILPPVGNEFVALLKDSSLVSVLAVSDLTRRGREYMSRTFLSFDTWILVALCYLVLTLFSSRAVEYIESKTRFER